MSVTKKLSQLFLVLSMIFATYGFTMAQVHIPIIIIPCAVTPYGFDLDGYRGTHCDEIGAACGLYGLFRCREVADPSDDWIHFCECQ